MTALCAVELQQAGIPIEVLDKPYGEPKSDVGGRLGDFTFRRAWYYWVVYGPMPLAQAEIMFADPAGRDISTGGVRTSSSDVTGHGIMATPRARAAPPRPWRRARRRCHR